MEPEPRNSKGLIMHQGAGFLWTEDVSKRRSVDSEAHTGNNEIC